MTVTLPLGFSEAAEAHRLRRSRREGRPLTAPVDRLAVARNRLRSAIIDVSRMVDVPLSKRATAIREALAPLPWDVTGDLAMTLALLGDDYERRLNTPDADDAWRALWRLAEDAAREVADGWVALAGVR